MFKRIRSLVLQELFMTRRSLEIVMDIGLFPLMNILLFGFVAKLFGAGAIEAQYLMVGAIFWQVIVIMQYNMTLSSLWNLWSHNLTNVFIAPISTKEYIVAHAIASAMRAVVVVIVLCIMIWAVFDFNILSLDPMTLVLATVNSVLFAFALGITLLGLIFRFGLKIQALAWGAIYIFQPLMAALFPVSVLPAIVLPIAYSLPATYVFEAARYSLSAGAPNWAYLAAASMLNIAYLVLAVYIFERLFRRSRQTGQFARNDLG